MAACYSSGATAPLQGLANAMLGESSFAAKSSTFSPAPARSSPNSLHSHHHPQPSPHPPPHLRHPSHHHPLLHPLSSSIRTSVPVPTPFEQAWSQHAHHPRPTDLVDPSEGYDHFAHHHHHQLRDHQHPSLHLTSSPTRLHHPLSPALLHNEFDQAWQHSVVSETTTITPASHVQARAQVPPLPAVDGSTLLADFQSFVYQPESAPNNPTVGNHNDTQDTFFEQAWDTSSHATAATSSTWAQEMHQDDDDSEDEFSQEWSNEAFTAAYVVTNKAEFDRIQAQDEERERRRLENQELEKTLRRKGLTTTTSGSSCTCAGQASHMVLREGGDGDHDEHLLLYEEFMRFNKDPNSPSLLGRGDHGLQHQQHHCHHTHPHGQGRHMSWESEFSATLAPAPMSEAPTIAPIRYVDGFESMTTDLHEAAMLYHPGAKSKTHQEHTVVGNDRNQQQQQQPESGNDNAWAHEFSSTIQTSDGGGSCQKQQDTTTAAAWRRYLGEWDWQSMFGKATTPSQQQLLASGDKTHTSGEVRHAQGPEEQALEHQRLHAVAVSRLAALFGHLSMQTASSIQT